MAFRWGIKMSLRHVRNPHMKKRVVTIAMAGLSVEVGAVVAAGATFELAMDIASGLSHCSVWTGDTTC
jgi:type II secretory pathway component PulF